MGLVGESGRLVEREFFVRKLATVPAVVLLPDDHPLWREPRCLITPHTGNTMEMAIPLLSERVRENVRRRSAGEPLLGLVDAEAGY